MSYVVKINGNPTIKLGDEKSALHAYQRALHWRDLGHSVELFFGSRNITTSPQGRGK